MESAKVSKWLESERNLKNTIEKEQAEKESYCTRLLKEKFNSKGNQQ